MRYPMNMKLYAVFYLLHNHSSHVHDLYISIFSNIANALLLKSNSFFYILDYKNFYSIYLPPASIMAAIRLLKYLHALIRYSLLMSPIAYLIAAFLSILGVLVDLLLNDVPYLRMLGVT